MTESTFQTQEAGVEETGEVQSTDDSAKHSELGKHEGASDTWPVEKLGSGCDDIPRTPIRDL